MNPSTHLLTRIALVFAALTACSSGGKSDSAATETTTHGASEGQTSTSGAAESTADLGTTASGATTIDATDAASDGCNFVCDTTDGAPVTCDPFLQDCPQGQKCNYAGSPGSFTWEHAICVPIAGDGQPGDPCAFVDDDPRFSGNSGHDDCALGHMCIDLQGSAACVELCGGDMDHPACPPDTSMSLNNVLCLCPANCDPLADTCLQGQICLPNWDQAGFLCQLPADDPLSPPGAPCDAFDGCAAGAICVDHPFFPSPACPELGGCCAPFCDLSQGTPKNPLCDPFAGLIPGVVCAPWSWPGDPPPGLASLGYCAAP
jgi:hypothetical protein